MASGMGRGGRGMALLAALKDKKKEEETVKVPELVQVPIPVSVPASIPAPIPEPVPEPPRPQISVPPVVAQTTPIKFPIVFKLFDYFISFFFV